MLNSIITYHDTLYLSWYAYVLYYPNRIPTQVPYQSKCWENDFVNFQVLPSAIVIEQYKYVVDWTFSMLDD